MIRACRIADIHEDAGGETGEVLRISAPGLEDELGVGSRKPVSSRSSNNRLCERPPHSRPHGVSGFSCEAERGFAASSGKLNRLERAFAYGGDLARRGYALAIGFRQEVIQLQSAYVLALGHAHVKASASTARIDGQGAGDRLSRYPACGRRRIGRERAHSRQSSEGCAGRVPRWPWLSVKCRHTPMPNNRPVASLAATTSQHAL
jgi:hypothetical protein